MSAGVQQLNLKEAKTSELLKLTIGQKRIIKYMLEINQDDDSIPFWSSWNFLSRLEYELYQRNLLVFSKSESEIGKLIQMCGDENKTPHIKEKRINFNLTKR